MKHHLANTGKAVIVGLTAALPVYATGPDLADRTLQVAFAGPFLAYLAYAYNVATNRAMSPSRE